MEGGCSGQNWAAPVAGLAGEGVGKDEGLTGARFVLTDGAGRLSAVAGGTRRRSFCSGAMDGASRASTARGGGVGWVKSLSCYGKGWPAANGRKRGAPRWAHRQSSAACRGTAGCSPYSGQLFLFASKQQPCIYPAVRWPSSTCVRRDRRQTAGRAAVVWRGTSSHAAGSRSQATGAKGNRLLVPRGGGDWPARTPKWRDSQRGAGTLGRSPVLWRRSRARPIRFQPVNATLTAHNFKNLNCATKTVDTKVVDETFLYHICKGRPMFFSTV
jgi:hypothetical protein